ncbi:hypothetical protein BN13_330023 [Nostocoides jenkinsii Ben 74]|uniref:Uncharacterized protein n=1 Tax=Nostocoides jenkinsii Ben 74 TaxID=1193518 RepID=A0A077MBM0_9MICO|nr:hypothetical protein BN13_330023 [Tetrasphaera jenkinsii Ben 74]
MRAEPRRPHHPQGVVGERHRSRGRCPQPLRGEVGQTAIRIDELQRRQPQRHRIDREVAATEVVLQVVAERDDRLAGLPVVGVCAIGRDLHRRTPPDRPDGAEGAPDVPGRLAPRGQDSLGLLRTRTRRQVQVGAGAPEEGITHRPADQGELMTRLNEPVAEVGQQAQGGAKSRNSTLKCLREGRVHDVQRYRRMRAQLDRASRRGHLMAI